MNEDVFPVENVGFSSNRHVSELKECNKQAGHRKNNIYRQYPPGTLNLISLKWLFKLSNQPGDSKCPFRPLVGGHLTP